MSFGRWHGISVGPTWLVTRWFNSSAQKSLLWPCLFLQRLLFLLTEPKFHSLMTLSRNNSRSKPHTANKFHIFGKLWTSAFSWSYPGYLFLWANFEEWAFYEIYGIFKLMVCLSAFWQMQCIMSRRNEECLRAFSPFLSEATKISWPFYGGTDFVFLPSATHKMPHWSWFPCWIFFKLPIISANTYHSHTKKISRHCYNTHHWWVTNQLYLNNLLLPLPFPVMFTVQSQLATLLSKERP